MQNHLMQHDYDHQERIKRAERERLAVQVIAQQRRQPSPTIAKKIGELLIEAGEQLIERSSQTKPAYRA